MGKSLNRKHPSLPLARTALLTMPLALFACSDKSEQKEPASPSSATAQGSPPQAKAARPPEQLYSDLGCKTCHGPGSAYAASLANARGKSAEVVAMWILAPQKIRPGTMMPAYAGRISTAEALALANWLKAGNPAPSE